MNSVSSTNISNTDKNSENIAAQAADWLVRLTDEDSPPSTQEQTEFQHWLDADPRHLKAVQRMQSLTGSLQNMPGSAARAALNANTREHANWSNLAKILSLMLVLVLPLWLLSSTQTAQVLMADKRTDINEWETWTLTDNSSLTLYANSAVDVNFDLAKRRLNLLKGELLIDVAHDTSRPLEVITQHGSFRALGTRFVVQKRDNATVLTVLESTVLASKHGDDNPTNGVRISAGEQITMYANSMSDVTQTNTEKFERNWQSRQLVVNGQPLSTVLADLAKYHKGHVSYDAAELSNIKVMAVLPLDDPERALQLLSESLPISVNSYSPWLVRVSLSK